MQETTTDDSTIGLLQSGYASRFGEVDLEGEVMQPQALRDIKSEWGAAARPPVYYNRGFDDAIGFRQIGECTRYRVDDVGLWVEVFLPREPDPQHFSGAALHRYRDVYSGIAGGKTTGLSLGGAKALTGSGIKRWSTNDLSVVDRPCLPSARFTLRRSQQGHDRFLDPYRRMDPVTRWAMLDRLEESHVSTPAPDFAAMSVGDLVQWLRADFRAQDKEERILRTFRGPTHSPEFYDKRRARSLRART